MGLYIDGDLLYLAAGEDGFYVFDISAPEAPIPISHYEAVDQPWDVWTNQGWVYLADLTVGLVLLDARLPEEPKKVGKLTWDVDEPMAEVVHGQGGFVSIAAGKNGLVEVVPGELRELCGYPYHDDHDDNGEKADIGI